jgi:integrase/recombinase XerD
VKVERQKFFESMRVRNFSPATLEDYGYTLDTFIAFASSRGVADVRGITKALLTAYQVHLFEKVNAAGTQNSFRCQNKSLGVVKSFCRFMTDEGLIGNDPSSAIKYAKTPKTLPRNILTVAETRKVLQQPNLESALGYRDRCILELLYSAGLRNQELRMLKVTDLNLEEGIVLVEGGKGNRDRYTPIGKIVCRYLKQYLAEARSAILKGRPSEYLIVSVHAQPLRKAPLARLVKGYVQAAGIEKTITPHSFRHACATHMLKGKAGIRHIQEILGHQSLLSTQIYTHVTIQDLKDVHNACHPRNLQAL